MRHTRSFDKIHIEFSNRDSYSQMAGNSYIKAMQTIGAMEIRSNIKPHLICVIEKCRFRGQKSHILYEFQNFNKKDPWEFYVIKRHRHKHVLTKAAKLRGFEAVILIGYNIERTLKTSRRAFQSHRMIVINTPIDSWRDISC